ncbi:MAG TPA: hypothetical protein VKR56_02915 [Candidatus Cybelea sp.]|nr:hypothetical protein [Candidatus Cybelea sp.]
MTNLRFGLCAALFFGAAAFLAACGGGPQNGAALSPDTARYAQGGSVGRDAALTMPHYVQRAVHPDRNGSSMSPAATTSKALLYVGDWSTNDVYVYDYKSGASVGTLTGDDEPYGMCVDAKGDIYVANFGSGTLVEYAHGGSSPIQTYSPGGEPIGCAVDARGDVAATSFDPGEVTVYPKGNPNKGRTYSNPDCGYSWSFGYDDKDNLLGVGEGTTIVFCAILANSKKMITLQGTGFPQDDFPGGVTWDGKYFAIGDQEMGGTYQTGVLRATLKGKTLTYEGETTFSDDCYSDYVDDVNPFIVGKKNTPVNDKQGNVMVGPNLWCVDAGTGKVDYWHYPAGGLPYTNLSSPPAEPYGAGVSIAQ